MREHERDLALQMWQNRVSHLHDNVANSTVKEKKTEKPDAPVEPVSIVVDSQIDEEASKAALVKPSSLQKPKATQPGAEGDSSIEEPKRKLNYWSIIEFLLAFATPFFMETLIIWFLEDVFPYHRPDFAIMTPVTTAFLMVSATRIVPPIIGLLLAIFLSKRNFKEPNSILLLWSAGMTAFIFCWVLYCRTVNTYWL